jgi:phosphate transport system substrate-binding protein
MKLLLFLLTLNWVSANEKIVIMGSDTLGAKMVPQLKEAYVKAGNEVDFEIAAEGSSQAFTNLLAGTAQIGISSRDVKEEEKKKFAEAGMKLVEHVAAWDMIAVVVNEKSKVKNLTLKQVEGIFTGDITDWKEVGGDPGKISVYTRNTASGTYKTFQGLAMSKRPYGKNTKKVGGSEGLAGPVSQNEKGIGYVGLAYAGKDGLRALKIDGVSPKPKNKTTYPLSRKLYYYTVGELTGEVEKFLGWAMNSKEAKEIVEKVGFISVD